MPNASNVTLNVLIVEDDPMISMMITKILELNNYAAQCAHDGEEALRMIEAHVPDLVMLDINIPKMDGYEVCRRLRRDARFEKIPILMITGNSDRMERIKGLELGADDFLLKPFNYDELLTRVLSTIRRSKKDIDANPLTCLPGTSSVERLAMTLISQKRPFAALKLDIKNFKAFNERYGFQRGDEVIRSVSREILSALDSASDYLAHLGSDDFMVITEAERIEIICEKVIRSFDSSCPSYYDLEDHRAGFIETVDRKGQRLRHAFLVIHIGCVIDTGGRFDSLGLVQKLCDEVLNLAKSRNGSGYEVDRRGLKPEKKKKKKS